MESKNKILIIYTGGTIGMIADADTHSLVPVDFDQIIEQLPELRRFDLELSSYTFSPAIDSSNVHPDFWVRLARLIKEKYLEYDGFVILHGTDTMAYSASALSFLLENLHKPVIFTGAQLPIGTLRTDGKENFISAIEIAGAKRNNQPLVPEVCVFFQNKLYRGNRTSKYNAEYFNAFRSGNYPHLAETGININYNYSAISYPVNNRPLKVHSELDLNVAVLKIFPGIQEKLVRAMIDIPGLKGLVLETYGSGNAPTDDWFIKYIENAINKGIVIVNVSQCLSGSVDMKKYDTGLKLLNAGVISGFDITTEAALTKLMFLLGQKLNEKEIRIYLNKSISGEITV